MPEKDMSNTQKYELTYELPKVRHRFTYRNDACDRSDGRKDVTVEYLVRDPAYTTK